jgi:hypothetical protein
MSTTSNLLLPVDFWVNISMVIVQDNVSLEEWKRTLMNKIL